MTKAPGQLWRSCLAGSSLRQRFAYGRALLPSSPVPQSLSATSLFTPVGPQSQASSAHPCCMSLLGSRRSTLIATEAGFTCACLELACPRWLPLLTHAVFEQGSCFACMIAAFLNLQTKGMSNCNLPQIEQGARSGDAGLPLPQQLCQLQHWLGHSSPLKLNLDTCSTTGATSA